MPSWDDERIVNHDEVEEWNSIVRKAAEHLHRNESLHRHDPEGVTCIYCAIAATRVMRTLRREERGPIQPTGRTMEYGIEQVVEAADELVKLGHTIDWQPGDGTRYELTLVDAGTQRQFLVCTSVKFSVEWRNQPAAVWVNSLPRGSWPGLRPLLAAAGVTRGPLVYQRDEDIREESRLRRGHRETLMDGERHADANLGAMVRHMLGERGLIVDDGSLT